MEIAVEQYRKAGGSSAKGLNLLLCLQTVIIVGMMIILALMPASRGPMIVVPLSDIPIKPWLDEQQGATLLGLGRLPGSIIVSGERDALLPVAIAHHAIMLPALPVLCEQNYIQQEAR